jgi:hypothetical protein
MSEPLVELFIKGIGTAEGKDSVNNYVLHSAGKADVVA